MMTNGPTKTLSIRTSESRDLEEWPPRRIKERKKQEHDSKNTPHPVVRSPLKRNKKYLAYRIMLTVQHTNIGGDLNPTASSIPEPEFQNWGCFGSTPPHLLHSIIHRSCMSKPPSVWHLLIPYTCMVDVAGGRFWPSHAQYHSACLADACSSPKQ